MNENIKLLFDNFSFNGEVSAGAIADLNYLCLPEDFIYTLLHGNGGEGYIGDEYLILWRSEDLITFNKEYEVDRYAPGIFLFGSNGSGEGYGFDMREKPYKIVEIPFIGMDLQYANHIADNFTHLLKRMGSSHDSLL